MTTLTMHLRPVGIDTTSAFPADPRERWASLDQAARNAAYDNNAAVTDGPRWIEQRNRASAIYREAHPAKLDLSYAPISERTAFDLYPAANCRRLFKMS